MSIISVVFARPVTFVGTGNDGWQLSSMPNITCTDKGNHLLFSFEVQSKPRRVKVPLTNIVQVTEDGEEPTVKGKEK